MNALSPIVECAGDAAWNRATAAAGAWRCDALQCFAEAETAVSEMLLLMASVRPDARVQLRHLVGQRFEDLRIATGPGGPFAKEGTKAAAALAAFHPHQTLRPFLCHGVMQVVLDRQGQWLAIFKVLTFRGGEADRSCIVYDRRNTERVLVALRGAAKQLGSALQSLRARIGNGPKPVG